MMYETLTQGPESERFLARLSDAMKYRDGKSQTDFVKVVKSQGQNFDDVFFNFDQKINLSI